MVQGSSHIALIINPTSGSARRRKMRMHLIKHARRHLRTGKTQLGITLTRHPQHATELVAEEVARGTRLIIACGGDGTAMCHCTGAMRWIWLYKAHSSPWTAGALPIATSLPQQA